jgi:23S rRNA (adenine2030-N6)-methyltransferase
MNYRHAFHAGGFTDVVKHLIVARIVAYLKLKPGAFRVIDTHAGIGEYDLKGEQAQRSPEWQDLEVVRGLNPDGLAIYPGSPLLVRKLFRTQDRLSAIEFHPEDVKSLGAVFAGDIQVRVIHLDGWLALGAHVPPKEKRGLVLVDPSFEQAGEWERLAAGLVKAHRRWPGGIYALWYPLKDPREVEAFVAALKATAIPKVLRAELTIRNPSTPPRLFGTGMIVVNPPFTLEGELRVLLPPLAEVLADKGRGQWKLEWIRGE